MRVDLLVPSLLNSTLCIWGDWSSWDGCSRTCGVGIQYRARTCQMPQHGGVNRCQGDNYEFQVCNTHECVDNHGRKTVDDFRDFQCQQLNNRALYTLLAWNTKKSATRCYDKNKIERCTVILFSFSSTLANGLRINHRLWNGTPATSTITARASSSVPRRYNAREPRKI